MNNLSTLTRLSIGGKLAAPLRGGQYPPASRNYELYRIRKLQLVRSPCATGNLYNPLRFDDLDGDVKMGDQESLGRAVCR